MTQLPSLSPQGVQALDTLLKTSVESRTVPATFFGLTNSEETFYYKCQGPIDFDEPSGDSVNEDTTIQIFSATKLVTTVASLQLVDRGLASLDDSAVIEKHLPELSSLRILKGRDDQDKLIWEIPTTKITLRMLLSHTSGLTYLFFNPPLKRWAEEEGINTAFLGPHTTEECYLYPLIFNPGSSWAYGVGLDWAGILISRITGKGMEEHYKEAIFDKAGMPDTTFYPTEEIKSRMMRMTLQESAGAPIKTTQSDFGPYEPLSRERDPAKLGPILSGGAGLFSTAKDYLAFLRGIMASQSGSHSDALLSAESFKELFTDSLKPEADHEYMFNFLKTQTYHDPALFEHAQGKLRRIGQSVGLVVNLVDSANGRKAGSGCWDGAAKTQYWLDPDTGLAGVCMTNVLGPGADEFFRLYNRFERAVYDALAKNETV